MPIPDKGFFDTQNPTDSLVNAKARREDMQDEAARLRQVADEAEARRRAREAVDNAKAREQEDEYVRSLVADNETREHLYARIQSMRTPAPEPPKPPPLSAAFQKRLEEEQACGRAAVARHEEARVLQQQAIQAKEDRERTSITTLEPVYVPNPTQEQQFPANKATLGKTK